MLSSDDDFVCIIISCEGNYVGQNGYYSFGAYNGLKAFSAWQREKNDYDFTTNTCAPGKVCGHWKQVSLPVQRLFRANCTNFTNGGKSFGTLWNNVTELYVFFQHELFTSGYKPTIPFPPRKYSFLLQCCIRQEVQWYDVQFAIV